MVSSNYLATDARRYPSRVMAPYSPPYPDRRDSYATHEVRNTTMSERDTVDESPAQRKRIAVAVSLTGLVVAGSADKRPSAVDAARGRFAAAGTTAADSLAPTARTPVTSRASFSG